MDKVRHTLRRTVFMMCFIGMFLPSCLSFYFLFESGTWHNSKYDPPAADDLKAFLLKGTPEAHEAKQILSDIFASPKTVGYTWPIAFILLALILNSEKFRNTLDQIFSRRNLLVGGALLITNLVYFWLAKELFPIYKKNLQISWLRTLMIVMLWLPVFGSIGYAYARRRGDSFIRSFGFSWGMIWRYFAMLSLYALVLTLLALLTTWLWIAPSVVLAKIASQDPKVLSVGPEQLAEYFRFYIMLVSQYWKWLSLYISIFFLIIVPAVFLSGLAFWQTAEQGEHSPQPKHVGGVLEHFGRKGAVVDA